MLITLCYSVLTWLQSRQRQEILSWIDEICVENKVSLVFMRNRLSTPSFPTSTTLTSVTSATLTSNSPSLGSLKRPSITTTSPINASNTLSPTAAGLSLGYSTIYERKSSQVSNLCYNYDNIKRTRLLWEEDDSRVLALFPLQIVELHHWCAFIGTELEVQNTILARDLDTEEDNKKRNETSCYEDSSTPTVTVIKSSKGQIFHILLEAEPGFTENKESYRKFSQFGRITAWKCSYELALILRSELEQVIELMHIFRLGQIVLEGGWRIYRLTTVTIQGTIGTLISKNDIQSSQTYFTPAELRRFSAGIYERGESSASISADVSKQELSKICSDVDCNSITKLELEEEEDSLKISELPNWYERSPKKRSIATIHYCEKPQSVRRKHSLCSNSLSNLSQKSSSLASLLFCSRSVSVDEDHRAGTSGTSSSALNSPLQTPDKENKAFITKSRSRKISGPSRQQSSFDSILSPSDRPTCSSPSQFSNSNLGTIKSMSTATLVPPSPLRSGLQIKSPSRLGKPPNILILSEDAKRRTELANILKSMLANDRYAIYDIRWDQIVVGGWSDQTALLVISGKIPDVSTAIPILLQFLGDGGRLFAWCCETHPFGLPIPESSTANDIIKSVNYAKTETQPVYLSGVNWGPPANKQETTSLPSAFQRVIETNDSEGYSRPLNASTFAKSKDNDVVIIQLDGGVMGGKAILAQVMFEKTMNDESSLGLLSLILSQNLGLDCTRIKMPEYTDGYLLGDHKVITEFLKFIPATIEQSELTLEFIPQGSKKYSKPSHDRFPIHSLQCPPNFSTVKYFENLSTKELGRLVIYADVLTSTQRVLAGHSLKHGLVVIGRRQTSGKGRGKNIWLSPEGCALFSFQLHLDLNSGIGRRISLVQHITALAIIMAVPNHKEINFRVKWPNDIYIGDKKAGGILVESQLQGKSAIINIGVGINVSNTNPTICLNSVLSEPLSIEVLIARALSEFETLLQSIENGPLDKLLDLYVENWIHNCEDEINVEVSEGKFANCHLVGIDEYGFLRVEEISSGHIFSVRPDGNSFDIANRLIAIKQ